MWTMDPRARTNINEAHKLLQIKQLPVLHVIRARLLFSACNYTRTSTEGAWPIFSEIMSKIYFKSNRDNEMGFDEQFANVEKLTVVN